MGPAADFNSSQLPPQPIERQADMISTAVRMRFPVLKFAMGIDPPPDVFNLMTSPEVISTCRH
jgi:hypothetical protein